MLKISKIAVPGVAEPYDIGTLSIPFGQVDSTSTDTAYTAQIEGITSLYDGVCVYLKNGVITSNKNGFTLNINGLGAKPVYDTLAAATRSGTVFNVDYTMLFVYNSSRVSGGCWDIFYGYNSDTTDLEEALTPLTGTTGTLTPMQVYNAIKSGKSVILQYMDDTYGLLSYTNFNVAESMHVIAANTIAYFNNTYVLAELWGDTTINVWGFMATTLAQKQDIPTKLPNPNALTFTGAVAGSYDGSAPLSVEIPSGGGAAVETWNLLINAEIAEDCTEVIFNSGDAGETLSDYKELLLLIDLFGNTGGFTSVLKIGFLNAVTAWHSPYFLNMTGYSAETVKYYINMFRFKKTEYGILPVNRYTQYNSGSVSNGLRHANGDGDPIGYSDFTLPISAKQHVTTDMTDFTSQKDFERLVIGGYQAVIGAGTIIKVWGMK